MPAVRVGIVSWNTADLLERCLAALPAAVAPLDADVVVVDNASTDGSADVASAHAGVTVIRNAANVGYARAMNQALAGSAARYLLALNPDTVPEPGSIAALAGALDAQPAAAVAVPQLLHDDGTLQHSVHRFPSLRVAAAVNLLPSTLHGGRLGRRLWLDGRHPHDRAEPVDWAIGAVHCLRASAVGALTSGAGRPNGPYRERWFMYVEDLDLCWRLRRDGWLTVLVPEARVVHVGNASGRQAWGEERTRRWTEATYDWYRLERGRVGARAWAAVSTTGIAAKWAWSRTLASLGGPKRDARLSWARQLRGWLPLHARELARTVRPELHRQEPPS